MLSAELEKLANLPNELGKGKLTLMQMMIQQRGKAMATTNQEQSKRAEKGPENKSLKMPVAKRRYKDELSSESATDDQRHEEKTSSYSSYSQGSGTSKVKDDGKRKMKPKEMVKSSVQNGNIKPKLG